MAYVTAGPPEGEPVLLSHGEPAWSFLYQRVTGTLAAAGLRVIAAGLAAVPGGGPDSPGAGPMAAVLKRAVPGAAGAGHPMIEGAGHFLQEDARDRLGAETARFVRAHPAR
jgi:pimeloyl-ACP methyl ester carboxylesterase